MKTKKITSIPTPKVCWYCQFMNQALGSCKCFNPLQTNKELTDYVYWSFSCPLFKQGERKSEQWMKRNGFTKKINTVHLANGNVTTYEYYESNKNHIKTDSGVIPGAGV